VTRKVAIARHSLLVACVELLIRFEDHDIVAFMRKRDELAMTRVTELYVIAIGTFVSKALDDLFACSANHHRVVGSV